jgi:hypothetical protein
MVQSRYYTGICLEGLSKPHKINQSGYLVYRPRFEPNAFRKQVISRDQQGDAPVLFGYVIKIN